MKLIDTHCHIDLPQFDADRECVLLAAMQNSIDKIIVPATTKNRWRQQLEICSQTPLLYPALGLHPVYLDQHKQNHLDELEQMLEKNNVVAVGEIGLDFFIKELDRPAQLQLVDSQLSIAAQFGLPVILHCRKAYDELITLLTHHRVMGGIAHAFNGNIRQADKLINLGFKLGFGGMLTYERSTKLRKLAKDLPLSSIVIETDSPYMTVAKYHGERNSPEYLPLVLQVLSTLRKEPIDELAYAIYESSMSVFKL